ncbi:MAG: helicase-associated domain-containing protein [Candidatus Latescibacterota bacterium]
MNLGDYLHDIPLKALKVIACSLGITVEYQARIKLLNAIEGAFWDGSLGIRLMHSLSEEQRRVLSLIEFSYDSGVHESVLAKKLEKLSGIRRRELNEIIGKLIGCALIGGVHGEDPRFFCLRGNAETIRRIFIKEALKLPDEPVSAPPSSLPSLMEDIIAFLAEAYREELPLTMKGRLKRTSLERIFSGSTTGLDTPAFFSTENRDTLVIDYLRERGLLVFNHRFARVTPLLDGWLEMTVTERIQDVAAFALARILVDTFTINLFAGILGEIPAGTKLNPTEFAYFLHSGTMATGGFARLQTKITQLLSILSSLGLFVFENGMFILTLGGERFFRGQPLSIDGNGTDLFTLQSNFEVIAGPELDLRIRFILELMSSRKNRDVIITYIINRSGVARARARGMNKQEIVDFFRLHSRTPLPQNVRFSLESWSKDYGSISFEPVILMRFQDPETCRSVLYIPEITPNIKEVLSDTALVVSRERIPVLTAILKRTGYLPEMYGESVSDPAQSGELFHSQSISDLIKENSIPEIRKNFFFPEDSIFQSATGNK